VSRATLCGSGRGFTPCCGRGGELVLSGVCVLHDGVTIRAELSVTVSLLGTLHGKGQIATTSASACPACCKGGSWEHQALCKVKKGEGKGGLGHFYCKQGVTHGAELIKVTALQCFINRSCLRVMSDIFSCVKINGTCWRPGRLLCFSGAGLP